ncbi:MAG: nucleoid occlusion factor SlmA [Betaproteobacteria bacterium]|nr:nucleoid occlusion factor SlmA [Betaproteobacteria bacterium]
MPGRKPGQRRVDILHMLARMLEAPRWEKVTTAALAARLEVSEAALYRHFASKAQMYEGLIEFIEETLFGLINRIGAEEPSGLKQVEKTMTMLLGFAQRNPGMTRVLIGDALVNEDERLQARINQLLDRVEASLKQSLRFAAQQGEVDPASDGAAYSALLLDLVIGRWHRFAKSGFKRDPMALWSEHWKSVLGSF